MIDQIMSDLAIKQMVQILGVLGLMILAMVFAGISTLTLTLKIVRDLLDGPVYRIGKTWVLMVSATIFSAVLTSQFNQIPDGAKQLLSGTHVAWTMTYLIMLAVLLVGEAVRSTNQLITMNDKMKEKRKARKA